MPLVSFALLRCSFICVVVAGKQHETGKRSLCYVACLLAAVSLVLSSLDWPLIGNLRLRFLAATQTADYALVSAPFSRNEAVYRVSAI